MSAHHPQLTVTTTTQRWWSYVVLASVLMLIGWTCLGHTTEQPTATDNKSAENATRSTSTEVKLTTQKIVDCDVNLCQACGPVSVNGGPVCGVECPNPGCDSCNSGNCDHAKRWLNNSSGPTWRDMRPMPFDQYGQGEYVGRSRTAHVQEYRIRVDDQLAFLYRLTREETTKPYLINVGDEFSIESFTDANLNKNLLVQPDGTVTLKLLGQVKATKMTIGKLRDKIEDLYKQFYKVPAITVTPVKVNTKLEDLRNVVDNRNGVVGGQTVLLRVNPEGTVALPAIGTVCAQGLTLDELKREIDLRYQATIQGVEVTPVLSQRAPRNVFVLGEVRNPGRYSLEGPTTVMQAIALAGSWNIGANLRQIVIFRRGDDWRLMATTVNLQGAMLFANQPCPPGELWVSDSDVILVPKGPLLLTDEYINLVFTRGIYGVVPFSTNYSWNNINTVSNIR